MKFVVAITWLLKLGVILCNDIPSKNVTLNSTDSNKDMYVINAMVYQVGIITNKTDDQQPNSTMGNQEALTLFRTNGSKIDLSSIPEPLLTNVTAQSLLQVAPKQNISEEKMGKTLVGWNDLKHLASLQEGMPAIKSVSGDAKPSRERRSAEENDLENKPIVFDYLDESPDFGNSFRSLFKRESRGNETTVKVVKGAVVVPQAAGVQSLAIPPLLTLNNNLSDIPVPIPNTSVVHYAKINTVIRNPYFL